MPGLRLVTINILIDQSRWEERRDLLVEQIAELAPDVVAVQEAHLPARNAEWLAERLGLTHVYISPKTGEAGQSEGIAVLSRLAFEHRETIDLLTQNRVAQLVMVRVDGHSLAISNVHLFWQAGDSPERLAQAELLLARLDELPAGQPVVVCGDFNAEPGTSTVSRMLAGFRSAFAAVHGREPSFTCPTPLAVSKLSLLGSLGMLLRNLRIKDLRPGWKGVLDYIFISPQVQVQACRVVLNRPHPSLKNIYPSDHFGLYAEILLEQENK